MTEKTIVNTVVEALVEKGFSVATEVANLYRSADIGAIDSEGNIWVIECKVSAIGRAIKQSITHKISADKVFIATFYRNTKESTLNKIKAAGLGLLYVMPDGTLSEPIAEPKPSKPWNLSRNKLLKRIREA